MKTNIHASDNIPTAEVNGLVDVVLNKTSFY